MSVTYKAVQWNQQKIIYDVILWLSVLFYLFLFEAIAKEFSSGLDIRGIWIRDFGSAAFILLHIILSIGPLTRLNSKFLPLLYNRRHMGVTMFILAWCHADAALIWYHDFGNLDPLVSLFVGNIQYGSLVRFPFETLGGIALAILFLMAATSHDFWLTNLTAPIWKALHMGVYLAYGLLIGHVVLGALQTNTHLLLNLGVAVGFIWIVGIHLMAGLKEAKRDRNIPPVNADGFVEVGIVAEIPDNRAKIVPISGERVAIFKYDGKIAAVSNVCQHQNGPLGEGKVVEGCITCPWHGYQYRPEDGGSPPPFTEKIPTFTVKLDGDRIFVAATPHPPGTPVSPAVISEAS